MVGLFFNIWPFTTMKVCLKVASLKIDKVGSKFYLLTNKHIQKCQRILKICNSDKFSGPKSIFSGHPRPLFHLFFSFQTSITILTANLCEKCYVHTEYSAGIRTRDLRNMSLLP